MGKKTYKTIYFIKGAVPTEEQREEADEIRGKVVFRNALKVGEHEACESFDEVAGDVPPVYALAAAKKAAEAGDAPDTPKASTEAPAAPQKAAKPASGGKGGGAWNKNS